MDIDDFINECVAWVFRIIMLSMLIIIPLGIIGGIISLFQSPQPPRVYCINHGGVAQITQPISGSKYYFSSTIKVLCHDDTIEE